MLLKFGFQVLSDWIWVELLAKTYGGMIRPNFQNKKAFPSGHSAAGTFLLASLLFISYDKNISKVLYRYQNLPRLKHLLYVSGLLGLLVQICRVLAKKHWIGNTFAGAYITLAFADLFSELLPSTDRQNVQVSQTHASVTLSAANTRLAFQQITAEQVAILEEQRKTRLVIQLLTQTYFILSISMTNPLLPTMLFCGLPWLVNLLSHTLCAPSKERLQTAIQWTPFLYATHLVNTLKQVCSLQEAPNCTIGDDVDDSDTDDINTNNHSISDVPIGLIAMHYLVLLTALVTNVMQLPYTMSATTQDTNGFSPFELSMYDRFSDTLVNIADKTSDYLVGVSLFSVLTLSLYAFHLDRAASSIAVAPRTSSMRRVMTP